MLLLRVRPYSQGKLPMSKRYITGPIAPLNRPTFVSVKHLSAGYAHSMIFWDVSFEVFDGQIVALLCKTEAQKALLITCLQGTTHAQKGVVSLLGTLIPPMTPALQQQVGIVAGSTLQQRMLALARVLTLDPPLIILDDPLREVAFAECIKMEQRILQLRSEGRTVLVVGTYPLAVERLNMYDSVIYIE